MKINSGFILGFQNLDKIIFGFKTFSRPIFIGITILILILISNLFKIELKSSWDLIQHTFDVEEFKF
jgi:hypothetical protein